MKAHWTLIFSIILAAAQHVHSAVDTVDVAFADTAGTVYRDAEGDFGSVASILVQPDGKILVGSNEMATTLVEDGDLFAPLIRFNPDGTVDNTFFADANEFGQGEGIVFVGQGWPEVMALGLQSDGKIIAGGVMTGMNDGTNNVVSRNIVRINLDGTVDPTFQTVGTLQWVSGNLNYINDLVVDPKDKVVIAGAFSAVRDDISDPWTTRHGLARLNADGSLDMGFTFDPTEFGVPLGAGSLRGVIYQVTRDPSGRYYIAGDFEWNGGSLSMIARVSADGSRDFSFDPVLPANVGWRGIAVEDDGKVTALGYQLPGFGSSVMVRFQPSGAPDPTFSFNGMGRGLISAWPLAPDIAGRYLVYGQENLYRILPDGSFDPSFEATAAWVNSARSSPGFNATAVAADGRIYAGGWFDNINGEDTIKIVRFEGEAVADGFSWTHGDLRIAENAGMFYLGVRRGGSPAGQGSIQFSTTNDTALAGTDFVASSGTLNWAEGATGVQWIPLELIDNATQEGSRSFTVTLSNPTGGVLSGPATVTVTIEDDEGLPEILIHPQSGAIFSDLDHVLFVSVGSATPLSFQWQADFGSGFEDIPGATKASFVIENPAVGVSDGSYRVVVTNDAGSVTSDPAAITVFAQAGAVDPTFGHGGSGFNNAPSFAAELNDGKILVVGPILSFNGTSFTPWGVIRLNANGTLDPTWNSGEAGATNPTSVSHIAVYPPDSPNAGKVIIGGGFRTYNGTSVAGAVRLNADGTRDTTWNAGTMVSSDAVVGVTILPDDSVLLGYRFAGFRRIGGESTTYVGHSGNLQSFGVQPDGGIVSLSITSTSPLTYEFRRNLPNGNLDPEFEANSGLLTSGGSFTIAADGSIYVAGGFDFNFDGNSVQSVVRLFPDGQRDESYNVISSLGLTGSSLLFDGEGHLYVYGPTGNTVNGVSVPPLFRLLPDGSVDSEFYSVNGGRVAFVDRLGRLHTISLWENSVIRHALGHGWLQFDAPTVTVLEDAGTAEFPVERVLGDDGPVTVDWEIIGGTAVAGVDFSGPTSGTLSWAEDDFAAKSISLALINDGLPGPDTTVLIQLSNPSPFWKVRSGGQLWITILDVDSPPRILTQPEAVTVPENLPATFMVEAQSAFAISYQWFFGEDLIPGAESASYTIPSVALADAGLYSVRVTNDNGFLFSEEVALNVLPSPTAIDGTWTNQPAFTGPTNYSVKVITPLGDGRALIGGSFNTSRAKIALVNADGTVDATFPQASATNFHTVESIVVQPDGKILIGGLFTQFGGQTVSNLVRLNPDFSIDTDFLALLGDAPSSTVNDIVLQPDGKILLAGAFDRVGDHPQSNGLARLHPDGRPDMSFQPAFIGTASFLKLATLEDGRIYAAGSFASFEGANRLIRLHPDGSRDISFQSTHANNTVRDLLVLPDGKLLIAGDFTTSSRPRFARLNEDGSHDSAYLAGVTINQSVHGILRQPNGRIVLAGNFTTFGSTANRFIRLEADGTIDATLSLGTGFNGIVDALALDPSGAIWVGGAFTQYQGGNRNRIVRLFGDPVPLAIANTPRPVAAAAGDTITLRANAAGTVPLTYEWFLNSLGEPLGDGPGLSGTATAELVLTGYEASDAGEYLVRVTNADGEPLVQTIATLETVAEPVIVQQPVGGDFRADRRLVLSVSATGAPDLNYAWTRDGSPVGDNLPYLIITNPDPATDSGLYAVTVSNALDSIPSEAVEVYVIASPSALDDSFPPLSGASGKLLLLPDGGLIIGGSFTSARNQTGASISRTRLAVYNADGTLHPANPGANNTVNAIVPLRDGGYLVGGNFTQFGGQPVNYLARINADFSYDPSFSHYLGQILPPASGTPGVSVIVPLPDGRIFIAGNFGSVNGLGGTTGMAILHPEGTVDTSFKSPLTNSVTVSDALIDDLGGIVVALFSGSQQPGNGFFRIDLTGTVDTGFTHGFALPPRALALTPEGDIITGGSDGSLRKVALDGSVDPVFGTDLTVGGISPAISQIVVQTDGRILVGGGFQYLGGPAPRIARFLPDGSFDAFFAPDPGFNNGVSSLALSADGRIWVSGGFGQYNGTNVNNLAVLRGDPVDLAFARTPADQALTPGDTLVLSGLGTGTTAVDYQWFLAETPLTDGGRISGSDTLTLTITDYAPTDAGLYTLRISNTSGHLDAAAEVRTLAVPVILAEPEGGFVFTGRRTSLRASGEAAAPATWQWFKDGDPLDGENDFVLILEDPETADNGLYWATLSNSQGDAFTTEVEISVILDPADFSADFLVNAGIQSSAIQALLPMPDGGVVIGGGFFQAGAPGNFVSRQRLARFLANGTLDPDFDPAPNSSVTALALDADGGILATGFFSEIGGVTTRFARLLPDGTVDMDFHAKLGTGPNTSPSVIRVLPNGQILVGGAFSQWNGQNRRGVVRLNADGTLDPTFEAAALNNFPTVNALDVQGSRVVIGGSNLVSFSDRLLRLEADGSIDGTFSAPLNNTVQILAVAPDNKIYISGSFTSVADNPDFGGLVRLLPDGGLDTSFAVGPVSGVTQFRLDGSGRLNLVGSFTSINGSGARLARLLPSGQPDPLFQTGSGFTSGTVSAIEIGADNRIWTGQTSNLTFKGTAVSGLLVLNGGPVLASAPIDPEPTPAEALETFLAAAGVPEDLRGPADDADGDGIPNVVEWIYELNPIEPTTGFELISELISGDGASLNVLTESSDFDPEEDYFTFSILLPEDTKGTTLTLQTATDLTDFDASPIGLIQIGAPVAEVAGFFRYTYAFDEPMSSTTKGFVRLKIDL